MAHQVLVVAGVRFSKIGKIYHFDASGIADVKVGESVVVETSRGWQLGVVAQVLPGAELNVEGGIKLIDRRATPRDLVLRQSWQQKEEAVVESCKRRVLQLNLAGVKIVSAEYSFDGSRLLINYSTESEERVDLKSLRQDMQRAFGPAQIELRQIGPRDVAKIMGGMGACGLETRCCSRFLTDFNSISIRMAKEQGISLTPTEITGMCGRLRCCLFYEYAHYVEARQKLPKRNKRVITPQGEGRVLEVFPLRQAVLVETVDQGVHEYPIDQIEPADEFENLQKKMHAPTPADGCQDCPKSPEVIQGGQVQPPETQNAQRSARRDRPRKPFRPSRGDRKKAK